MEMTKNPSVIYIGDFDLRNENVQSFLVKNNAKILRSLGYTVAFVGINTSVTSFDGLKSLEKLEMEEGFSYLELPNTLNVSGVFKTRRISTSIKSYFDEIASSYIVKYLISYQCPSYSILLKWVIQWCKRHSVKYIVNCADLPIFDNQPFLRRVVMAVNWSYLHRINKKNADGVISVSKYIQDFYKSENRKSVIIPPLFDCNEYVPSFSKRDDKPVFVYAGIPFKTTGNAVKEKGMKDRLDMIIDLFLKLSAQSVPYVFKIIGIEQTDYCIGVPRHAGALNSCKDIEFLGRLNHETTLITIADADFTINYRDENRMTQAGFSTKIVESISVGTPVVINEISDIFDYIERGSIGFQLDKEQQNNIRLLAELCGFSKEKRKAIKQYCVESKLFHVEKYTATVKGFLEAL